MTSQVEDRVGHEQIMAEAERIRANGETRPRAARDPVNQPMVNNWVEAIGDTNPRYTAGEAPPAMAQVWTMGGLHPQPDPDNPLHAMMQVLTDAGYTGVLGTNCEQTYDRYLRIGEEVTVTALLDSVVGPKQTGVGEGYFVTTRNVWRVTHPDGRSEQVATMLFRVLKFRPRHAEPEPGPVAEGNGVTEPAEFAPGDFVLRPTINRDSAYFWEGTRAGELRIQRCGSCGALRHPPGPTCPQCLSFDRTHLVASGRGTVFSYVVHRHPPIPGYDLPIPIALVDLEEGVRVVATVEGVAPEELRIGMPVEVDFRRIDDELTLPVWRRA
ncbi:MAG TPA: bifunctional MaoC family dehydratase N-terminal/OB-fold nucleic acid binding domain-containing protein [Marmoricola sp.]|nr:bifunctional MaoC family dehydratase N-terminal/OB-fold nucleic acid binding domain-containing protein [Marmoricola sp.]